MAMQTDARPAGQFAAVTPHASTDIAQVLGEYPRALYVGVAGDLGVVGVNGEVVTFKGAAAGSVIPVRCRRVNATGTTATDIVALY